VKKKAPQQELWCLFSPWQQKQFNNLSSALIVNQRQQDKQQLLKTSGILSLFIERQRKQNHTGAQDDDIRAESGY
jgi:hypothetical protein